MTRNTGGLVRPAALAVASFLPLGLGAQSPNGATEARRAFRLASALILVASLGTLGADAQRGEEERGIVEAPQVLYSKLDPAEQPEPIWVAASELVEGDSSPQWQLLGETWAPEEGTLKQHLSLKGRVAAVPEEDCAVMHNRLTWSSGTQRARDGLASFLEEATGVFAGTVVGHTPGFYVGALATVLTIDVSETLRSLPETKAAPYLYVVYPRARFALDGRVYCAQHEVGPGIPPVGSKVVVLAHHGPSDEQGLLFQVSVEEVLGVSPGRGLVVPERLGTETVLAEAKSWEELLATVRSLITPRVSSEDPELPEQEGRN